MFTNDSATCDHNHISIVIEQEEIQQYDLNLKEKTITRVFNDLNQSEPIMITCNECKSELKFDDITIQAFIAEPLLDNEKINVISYVLREQGAAPWRSRRI